MITPGIIPTKAELQEEVDRLRADNAALRADKERLDWLDAQMKVGYFWEYQSNHRGFIWLTNSTSDGLTSARAAIDAARKEQP